MKEMVENLTLSYASRRLMNARKLAEQDVFRLEHSDGDVEVVRIGRRKKVSRRSTNATLGKILWKTVDGVEYYYRAGDYMLVRGEYIYSVARNPQTLREEWRTYQEHISRHNEHVSNTSFSDIASWFQEVHGAPLPAREDAEQIYESVEAAVTSNGWTGSVRRMDDPAGYLAVIETQSGRIYADHQNRPDLALLLAYVEAWSLKLNALMAA